MIRFALAIALLAGGSALARAPAEPPERVRLQKEWLSYLGYYQGPAGVRATSAYRAARLAFASDVGLSGEDPAALHRVLEATYEANVAARVRGCAEPTRGRALACRD